MDTDLTSIAIYKASHSGGEDEVEDENDKPSFAQYSTGYRAGWNWAVESYEETIHDGDNEPLIFPDDVRGYAEGNLGEFGCTEANDNWLDGFAEGVEGCKSNSYWEEEEEGYEVSSEESFEG